MNEKDELLYKICKDLGLSDFDAKKYVETGKIIVFEEKAKDFYISEKVLCEWEQSEAEDWWNKMDIAEVDGEKYRVDFIL